MSLTRLISRVCCAGFLQFYTVFSVLSLMSVFMGFYELLVTCLFPFGEMWFREARGCVQLRFIVHSGEFLLLVSYTGIGSQYRKNFEEEVRKAIFLKKKMGDEG